MSFPLRFADAYSTVDRGFSFGGLGDGEQHLGSGLGDRSPRWSLPDAARCRS
jgi:hypothetical protein